MTLNKGNAILEPFLTNAKAFSHLIQKYPVDRMVMVMLPEISQGHSGWEISCKSDYHLWFPSWIWLYWCCLLWSCYVVTAYSWFDQMYIHSASGQIKVDACTWWRLWFSFGLASVTLCNGLAAITHRLCVDDVDSAELVAFVTCGLIPLDKKPGVWPIRVGDVPWRVTAKAILYVIISCQLGLFKHVLVMMLVLELHSCYEGYFWVWQCSCNSACWCNKFSPY